MKHSFDRRSVLKGTLGATLLTAGLANVTHAQNSTPDVSPVEDGDVRVISAANGEIEVQGTPERIVVMEYELAENAYILGITPAGLTERDSVSRWVPLPEPFPETVADVGTRDEPDLEAIIALQPDLILAASPRQDEVLANLETIATTVQLQTYSPFFTPAEDITPIQHFQQVLTQVAQATNREQEAEAAIAGFDALLAAGAEAVAATEYAGRPFVYLTFGDFTTINLFNEHSRIAYTISQLGLANQGGENTETPGLHYETRAVEDLGTLPADTLVFVSISPEIADDANAFLESDLIQGMPWIDGLMNLGEPNVWTAGSAITLSNLIERVVAALGGTIEN